MDTRPLDARDIIDRLQLAPHPEGGHYRETFRDHAPATGRATSTAILYLLQRGEISRWHRVDAAEVWHWHAGAPLELSLSRDGTGVERLILGNDLQSGQVPQLVVPAHCWQMARPLGDYALVGCTVAPGFEFSGFEMAPPHWEPGARP
jgi:predicted cupin superfamily sugar epimerase